MSHQIVAIQNIWNSTTTKHLGHRKFTFHLHSNIYNYQYSIMLRIAYKTTQICTQYIPINIVTGHKYKTFTRKKMNIKYDIQVCKLYTCPWNITQSNVNQEPEKLKCKRCLCLRILHVLLAFSLGALLRFFMRSPSSSFVSFFLASLAFWWSVVCSSAIRLSWNIK